MPQTYYFVTFSAIWYRTQKMTCFFERFLSHFGSAFFSALLCYYCVTHKCVPFKIQTHLFWVKRKKAKYYALNLNCPRPLDVAIPLRDRHLFFDLLRMFACLARLRAIDHRSNGQNWTWKYEKQKSFDVYKQKSNMHSAINKFECVCLVLCVFFFALEIFPFIDNPNNPFRWLVRKIIFWFVSCCCCWCGCYFFVLVFIGDFCGVVTNNIEKKTQKKCTKFRLKKRKNSELKLTKA